MGGDGTARFAEDLSRNEILVSLDNAGAAATGDVIKTTRTLESVYIGNYYGEHANHIGLEDFVALADGLVSLASVPWP
jgi:hypothetical protein